MGQQQFLIRLTVLWINLVPVFQSLTRAVIGLLILEFGTMKLFAFPVSQSNGDPLPPLLVAAGFIELVGGSLLLVGLFTRFAGFILSGEMAFAYFLWHSPKSIWPGINGGSLAITWCFVLLFLSAAGAGPWSIDHIRRRARAAPSQSIP